MGISIGLLLQSGENVRLSAHTFLSDGTRLSYSKCNLFGPEQQIFIQGEYLLLFGYQHHHVAIAICADISVEEYARDAVAYWCQRTATRLIVGTLPAGRVIIKWR